MPDRKQSAECEVQNEECNVSGYGMFFGCDGKHWIIAFITQH